MVRVVDVDIAILRHTLLLPVTGRTPPCRATAYPSLPCTVAALRAHRAPVPVVFVIGLGAVFRHMQCRLSCILVLVFTYGCVRAYD